MSASAQGLGYPVLCPGPLVLAAGLPGAVAGACKRQARGSARRPDSGLGVASVHYSRFDHGVIYDVC